MRQNMIGIAQRKTKDYTHRDDDRIRGTEVAWTCVEDGGRQTGEESVCNWESGKKIKSKTKSGVERRDVAIEKLGYK